jgi:CrcB protein
MAQVAAGAGLMVWLAVAVGGALGSLARYALKLGLMPLVAFPWWTLIVNVSGGLLIGLMASLGRDWPEALRIGLIVGLLGGFTTFSAFSLETLELLRHQPVLALANVLANVTLALAACAAGLWLGQRLS